jgi:hypothetical protein
MHVALHVAEHASKLQGTSHLHLAQVDLLKLELRAAILDDVLSYPKLTANDRKAVRAAQSESLQWKESMPIGVKYVPTNTYNLRHHKTQAE